MYVCVKEKINPTINTVLHALPGKEALFSPKSQRNILFQILFDQELKKVATDTVAAE